MVEGKKREKILWLASWYPNELDPYDGDFIQRHARAAAIHHDIFVIAVCWHPQIAVKKETVNRATGLTEKLIYLPPRGQVFSSLTRQLRWGLAFREAVTNYIKEEGLPKYIHVQVPWKAGLVALWAHSKWKIPYLVTEHWGVYDDNVKGSFRSFNGVKKRLLKEIFTNCTSLISVSRYLADGIEKMAGRPTDLVLPNVVDTTLFHPSSAKYERFSFIHVSNMVPLKNVDTILVAFHELDRAFPNRFQLIMVGNRDNHYADRAEALGLLNRSVFFRGEVSYREVAEELRRCHCLVIVSDTETFSCVTAEALCSGIPVIASSIGALPELVDTERGVLVSPGNKKELAEAMQNIAETYTRKTGERLAAEASARFGYGAVSEAFERLYSATTIQKG